MTELTRLLGPSQERGAPPLLGLEKADLLELMPPSEVRGGGWGTDIGTKEGKWLKFSHVLKHLMVKLSVRMTLVHGGRI